MQEKHPLALFAHCPKCGSSEFAVNDSRSKRCRNCGFVIEAEQAPLLCPACKHPQAYFEPKKENY